VFTNDFAALLPDTPSICGEHDYLLRCQSVRGTCRVLCFSPRHDLTLAEMPLRSIRRVVDLWTEQMTELGQEYRWVQVFENKGPMMGASNPHPHGQVWASDVLPNEPAREDRQQRDYWDEHSRRLLLDYARLEAERQERVIVENEHWLAVVPYWAVWPFEALLLPCRPIARLPDLTDLERDGLVSILKRLLAKYDNLFEIPFPYSMGWHGAPREEGEADVGVRLRYSAYWQLHAHFYPPLLRSATVKKFMVGYEMLAGPQRDITAEQAAERLRELSDVHYSETE
jgi:UDPglucose--hexose-1-phosphate uridylyltransferase